MKIISLGHRCHLNQMLIKYNMRHLAYPFDNIISKLEGVIYCVQNEFEGFFPKEISKETFYVGSGDPHADNNGNRYLFRNRSFAFTHHDLSDNSMINNFKRRIERFIQFLESTDEEILFIRTVLDDDEIKLIDKLSESIKKRFPKLVFKLALIYDNAQNEQGVWSYKSKHIVANSCHMISDQNSKTSDSAYSVFFGHVMNKTCLDEIMADINNLPDNLVLKNDSYKGYALKGRMEWGAVYPFKDSVSNEDGGSTQISR